MGERREEMGLGIWGGEIRTDWFVFWESPWFPGGWEFVVFYYFAAVVVEGAGLEGIFSSLAEEVFPAV